MAFVSVPEERFVTDVTKSWVKYLSGDATLAGVNILIKQPDVDENLKLPALVLKRVSNETWILSRLRGYYGKGDSTETTETRRYGYCYKAMIQLDVYSTTITGMNSLVAAIMKKLKPSTGLDVFAPDSHKLGLTRIPIYDFPAIDSEGEETDLAIQFKLWTDVESMNVVTFDPELHQTTVSVSFWVDYITEYSLETAQEISPNLIP